MKNIPSITGSRGIDLKLVLKDGFFIISGIFAAAFGLESFLLPNRFIDGGATGISLLITETSSIPLYLLIIYHHRIRFISTEI